jgi:hypothetical protein
MSAGALVVGESGTAGAVFVVLIQILSGDGADPEAEVRFHLLIAHSELRFRL